eukprot:GHUV01047028.1.p3 GENE.GHUV01047028.1~~GHUV01047028.1.p3  ORF type:complete len:107 (-),score=13.37 GHUV01047028.1:361-681(-)
MFLDVATVLRGHPKELALTVWDAWHGSGASVWFEGLERRNLLSSDDAERLQMHDVLVALGRSLLLENSQELPVELHGSRVWGQNGTLQGYRKVSAVCNASRFHLYM